MLDKLLKRYIFDPNNEDCNYDLGLYYDLIGQTASAVSFYLRCAERSKIPEVQYECLLKAASCFEAQGKRNFTVRGLLQHAVSILPKRPEAYYLLARFYEREDRDGSWQDSYMIASIGEKVADFNSKPLRNSVDYPGSYAVTFQKAVAAWWCGLCEESRDLFIELNKNLDLDDNFRSAVDYNMVNLNIDVSKNQ
jgi:tetratricopeptide (TPR) repeat protein